MSTVKQRINKIEKQLHGEASVHCFFQSKDESYEEFVIRVEKLKERFTGDNTFVLIRDFSAMTERSPHTTCKEDMRDDN
jgi:hypothetical protein